MKKGELKNVQNQIIYANTLLGIKKSREEVWIKINVIKINYFFLS